MKNGQCPMCGSSEVYMTDYFDTVRARSDGLRFQAMQGSDTAIYRFDTYVCTDCGFTAMFAKSEKGLAFLKQADMWKKVK